MQPPQIVESGSSGLDVATEADQPALAPTLLLPSFAFIGLNLLLLAPSILQGMATAPFPLPSLRMVNPKMLKGLGLELAQSKLLWKS